jgi:hypothetical protein
MIRSVPVEHGPTGKDENHLTTNIAKVCVIQQLSGSIRASDLAVTRMGHDCLTGEEWLSLEVPMVWHGVTTYRAGATVAHTAPKWLAYNLPRALI